MSLFKIIFGKKRKSPHDIREIKLEDIAMIIMGQSPPSSSYNEDGRGVPFIQGKAEFRRIYPVPRLYTTRPIKVANPRDILISVRAPVGDVNIANKKICIGRGIAAIRVDKKLADPLYVFYFLQLIKPRIEAKASGSTFKAIRYRELAELKIKIPPLPEQKKIAEILRAVDEAIEKTDEAIERTERLKKGLMQRLLTRGIKHERFKKTELGEIPEEWRVVRLGEIVEVYDNQRIPLSEKERANRKGLYPYCGANGIIDYIDEYIFEGEYVLLAEDGGYYGPFEPSAYIMMGKFWVNNHAHVLKAKKGIANNQFILYVLNFLDLTPYVVGSTRKKLNQSHMKRIKIPLPPLEEQKQIAEILSTVDRKLELLRQRREKLERVKRGLMKDLLTGRRRVKAWI